MVGLPSEFRASLDTYSGPLDLLLYLIKKDEVDIFDIPLASVIQQYQIYLELLKDLDPNACGEFLVMAANLMEIKSKLLLPRETLEEDEELEDPRMELVRQLLEYKKYKERAMLLAERLEEQSRRYKRPPTKLPLDAGEDVESPLYLGNVSVWDLLTAFHKIQIALGQRAPIQVVAEDRPLDDYMNDVVALLEAAPERRVNFEDLFRGSRNRQEAIGYFLALLELAKEYRIKVSQEDQFGTIHLELRSEEELRRFEEEAALTPAPDGVEASEAYLLQGEGPGREDAPATGERSTAPEKPPAGEPEDGVDS